jgi:hypothetical protein
MDALGKIDKKKTWDKNLIRTTKASPRPPHLKNKQKHN